MVLDVEQGFPVYCGYTCTGTRRSLQSVTIIVGELSGASIKPNIHNDPSRSQGEISEYLAKSLC